jgi:hypothetical protein
MQMAPAGAVATTFVSVQKILAEVIDIFRIPFPAFFIA